MRDNLVSMMNPLGLRPAIAPGVKLPDYGIPNSGVAYIEGQVVALGGARTFNFNEDYADYNRILADLIKSQLGLYSGDYVPAPNGEQNNEDGFF